jgi:transcriptional regulator with XRE-family HTH domain
MTIGEKIKNRRIELGWSQQTLATKMGYTNKSTITRIEKGYNDVSQKNIAKSADTLILLGLSDSDSPSHYSRDNLRHLEECLLPLAVSPCSEAFAVGF